MNILQDIFSSNVAYAFVWTILHSMWQCLLVASVLAISLKLNRQNAAQSRYLMAISALVACVVISVATYLHVADSMHHAQALVSQSNQPLLLAYTGGISTDVYRLLNRNIDIILMLWLIGFVLQAYLYLKDFFYAQYLKSQHCERVEAHWVSYSNELADKLHLNKFVDIKNSTQVSSICVIGHFKPVILLPIGMLMYLPKEQVEALLLHELAHIKRNDYLVKSAQNFVRLLYFFNPSVLWISKMIDVERENACDDIAVKHCKSANLYATSLANISELEINLNTVLAANSGKFTLLPRISRLLNAKSKASQSVERISSLLCAMGIVLALNLSTSATSVATPMSSASDFISSNTLDALESQLIAEEATFESVETVDEQVVNLATVQATPAIVTVEQPEPQTEVVTELVAAPQVTKAEQKSVPVAPKPMRATPALDRAVRIASTNTIVDISPMDVAMLEVSEATPSKSSKAELKPFKVPEFNKIYIADSLSLPAERSIYIDDISVEFAEVWLQRFSSKTSESYRQNIQRSYSDLLKASLESELSAAGWTIAKEQSNKAITLNAKIHSLYIVAPEVVAIKEVIIAQAGQSGIELVFADSEQTEFIKIVDYRNTQVAKTAGFQASRVANQRYFKMLMDDWSKDAIKYLNSVSDVVQQQTTAATPSLLSFNSAPIAQTAF